MMTPEQRAADILDRLYGKPMNDKSLPERLIAAAVREAALEEREACARLVEEAGRSVDPSHEAMALGMICERIRARALP
jgi:hypothetical protein